MPACDWIPQAFLDEVDIEGADVEYQVCDGTMPPSLPPCLPHPIPASHFLPHLYPAG
jgi:hypothetical protein